jgi:urease alpha subunit
MVGATPTTMTDRRNNMQKFISKPSIDMYGGIKVTKDTTLEYKNENVEQTLKDLVFKSKTIVKAEDYTSEYNTTINLKDGDILIFEEEGRGYIKPVDNFVTVEEAIEELECIKEV